MIARLFCAAALSGCFAVSAFAAPRLSAEQYDALVAQYAKAHGLPEKLIHRVIMRESRYNAAARNRSYWGLMQITYATARSMGYKGTPAGLLDPGVNLTYAVPVSRQRLHDRRPRREPGRPALCQRLLFLGQEITAALEAAHRRTPRR